MHTKQKRWMKSVIAAAKADTPALPFQRGHRKSLVARRAEAAPLKAA